MKALFNNKLLFVILVALYFGNTICAQEELIPDKQFMFGCTNVGSTEEVTHYINVESEVWQYSSGIFIRGGITSNSVVTIGNADFGTNNWPGFNFSWLNDEPYWSLGLYKVTNSKQTDKYFYLDARDSDFGAVVYLPDFWIYFDNGEDGYFHRDNTPISQGEVVRVWEIHGESPNTSGLEDFWDYSTLCVKAGNNKVVVVWGKHPSFSATNYKVYRALSNTPANPLLLTFNLLTTVSSSTYDYIDADMTYDSNPDKYAYYYIKAYNSGSDMYSDRTNIASAAGDYLPQKELATQDEILRKNFSLVQNYPNPFNPSTKITYIIPEKSFVSLKVYDILGNVTNDLVNEMKEGGEYIAEFNAAGLSSGVYFYKLNAGNYMQVKKMILTK